MSFCGPTTHRSAPKLSADANGKKGLFVPGSPAPKDDDGSLSRLATKLGIRYINLECGLGKIDRQRELLGWLEENLA
jgi:hypothetical protein